jgi:hypothetical protein
VFTLVRLSGKLKIISIGEIDLKKAKGERRRHGNDHY